MKHYVIIGNGTAAVGCIEGIRSVDTEGTITVVSGENRPTYCRPLISYYLEGRTDEKRMLYRAESFYSDQRAEVMYGIRATSLTADKTITLENGHTLQADAVCLATGSSPFVPPMEGIETVEKRFSFLTMEDALALEQAVTPDSRVFIIGAGLIGLKCAEGLHDRVKSITVADLADRVLSSILDADGAAVAQQALEGAGLTLLLGDSVARFEGNTAVMKSGKTVDFDVLVTAVGVRPNTALVKDAGGSVGRGITVNEHMETSLPGIYAAGDCTESTDISDGNTKIMALMPNACLQGFAAGVNMAGGDKVFDNAIPMNSIGFFGCHIMTAGSRGQELVCQVSGEAVKKLYTDGTHLTGFEIIGDVRNTGIYTSLIRSRADITGLQVKNMEKTPDLSLFEAKTRQQMLGGVG